MPFLPFTHRPTYLSDLLQFRTSSRHLCSSDHCLLYDAGTRTVFCSRAFCNAALAIWNLLPADLTDNFNSMLLSGFECSLNTRIYKLSFMTYSQTVSAPAIRFFKLTWCITSWLIDWLIDWWRKFVHHHHPDHLSGYKTSSTSWCFLPGPEQVCPNHSRNDLSFYIRRWWPSKYEVGHLQEIYVTDLSLDTTLNKVLSLISLSRSFYLSDLGLVAPTKLNSVLS